jgi:hypothetical protein
VADCLWIAGLLWELLAALLISIMVSLIHSLMDCIPEAYCGRLSLDSRTAVELAGSVAHIHNGQSRRQSGKPGCTSRGFCSAGQLNTDTYFLNKKSL